MATEKKKVIIEVEVDNKKAVENAAKLTVEIAKQEKELAELRKQFKEGGSSSQELAAKINELSRSVSENKKQLGLEQKELGASVNSINALRAEVAKLTDERNKLDMNSKEFENLTSILKDNVDKLKELEKQVGDTRRNVGNYKEAVTEALAETNIFGGSIGEVISQAKTFITSIRGAVGGLSALKAALAATGLGLLLVVLGSVAAYFQRSEEGAQKFRVAIAFLEGAINTVIDLFIDFGKVIVDAFENPEKALDAFWKGLVNNVKVRGESFLKIYTKIWEVAKAATTLDFEGVKKGLKEFAQANLDFITGIENSADAAAEFAKKVLDNAAANAKLEKSLNKLKVEQREQIVISKQIAAEQAKLNAITENSALFIEDRIRATKEFIELENKALATTVNIARKEYEIERQRNALSISGEEALLKEAELRAKVSEAELASAERKTTQQTKLNGLYAEQKTQASELVALDKENADILAANTDEAINSELEKLGIKQQSTLTYEQLIQREIDANRAKAKSGEELAALEKGWAEEDAARKQAAYEAAVLKATLIGEQLGKEIAAGEDANKALRKQVKETLKMVINEAVVKIAASVASNVPPPFGLILAPIAAAGASLLLNSLVEGFATGGIVKGGMPVNRSNGDNVLITAKKGEAVLTTGQQKAIGHSNLARAGVPGFATGGVVGAAAIKANVASNNIASQPVYLDYAEFTAFTNKVKLKESRANR